MNQLTTLLVVALVCASIGYIAGLMITNMRKDSSPPPRRASDHILEDDPAYLGVARLARDTINGPLLIEMEGRYYRSPGEMNPDMRTRMEELTIELHSWLGYPLAPSRAEPGEALVEEPPVAELEPVEPPIEAALVEAVPAVPLAAAPPAPSEPARQPVKTGPLPAQAPSQPQRNKAPQSIVEQIDDILQANMVGTEYMEKGIRLFETPNRGVAVRVGLEQFQLDEVPDPAIRAMIRAAVSEWELQAK